RAPDPVLRPSLLRTRQTRLAALFAGTAGLGEAGMVFIPALAVAALGVSSSTSSLLLLPVVLALAAGAPLIGRLLDVTGSRVVITLGLACLAAGSVLTALAGQTLAFILCTALMGLGLVSVLGAPLRYILLNEAAPEDRTAAQGLLTIFTSVGQLLSGALVGAVAQSRGGGHAGYSAAFTVIGAVAFLAALAATGLKGHAEERTAAQTRPA
ncbi:MAG TPA: MFS transporter, partial [Deinococcales bacterium]|nr:MFS transporter [Deinococcales bacterium]